MLFFFSKTSFGANYHLNLEAVLCIYKLLIVQNVQFNLALDMVSKELTDRVKYYALSSVVSTLPSPIIKLRAMQKQ